MLERGACPRGLAVLARLPRRASRRSPGSACCSPTRSPPRSAASARRAAPRQRRPTRTWPTSRAGSTSHGHQRPDPEAGPDGAADAAEERRSSARATSSRSRATCSSRSVTIGFDLVLMFVLSIYMLLYGKQIGELVRRIMPPRRRHARGRLPAARPARGVRLRPRAAAVQPDHGRQRRARAVDLRRRSGSSPTASATRVFFGVFYGLMELIPYIGPILGPIAAGARGAVQRPDQRGLGGRCCSSRCSSSRATSSRRRCSAITLRINPILIIFALLLGCQLYGIVGALVALPIAAVMRETVVYLRRHLVLEPWASQPGRGAAAGARATERVRACPECGAAPAETTPSAARCGASLQPRVRSPELGRGEPAIDDSLRRVCRRPHRRPRRHARGPRR